MQLAGPVDSTLTTGLVPCMPACLPPRRHPRATRPLSPQAAAAHLATIFHPRPAANGA